MGWRETDRAMFFTQRENKREGEEERKRERGDEKRGLRDERDEETPRGRERQSDQLSQSSITCTESFIRRCFAVSLRTESTSYMKAVAIIRV